jgi:hypothetical protein
MHLYIPVWRNRRKIKAADVILSFFQEVYDVSKLMKIVKKYRYSVIKAQAYVRSFLVIRNAQVKVIAKYWDKLETLWWAQKGKDTGEDADDKKANKQKKKKKKDDMTAKIPE